jgi:hypothetical protein
VNDSEFLPKIVSPFGACEVPLLAHPPTRSGRQSYAATVANLNGPSRGCPFHSTGVGGAVPSLSGKLFATLSVSPIEEVAMFEFFFVVSGLMIAGAIFAVMALVAVVVVSVVQLVLFPVTVMLELLKGLALLILVPLFLLVVAPLILGLMVIMIPLAVLVLFAFGVAHLAFAI